MSPTLDQLREYVDRCDPIRPLIDERDLRFYVPFDEGHGVRGDALSCMDQLRRNILLSRADRVTCQLFTGFPGSGKTTELHRLSRALEADTSEPSEVVFIDALAYVDRYAPLNITDLLRVLAYHLDRSATLAEGGDPDRQPGYARRLWRWLQSDVELKEIGFEAYGASLMAEIRENPTFRQKVEAILQLRFQEFAREAHEVIAAAVTRLRVVRGRRVVVIVDSLEKMSSLRAEDRPNQEASVEAVFSSHAELLRLPCHTIYTFPIWLRHRAADLGVAFDSPPLTLPMVKIREIHGAMCGEGIARLVELVARRIDQIDAIFGPSPEEALRPLILASGGYPRDLLRLVRDCLRQSPHFPIPSDTVQRMIGVLRQEYERVLLLADLDVLVHVATHHALPPGEGSLRAAAWSLDRWQVLTYRNGEEWFDVHPLLLASPMLKARLAEQNRARLSVEPQPVEVRQLEARSVQSKD